MSSSARRAIDRGIGATPMVELRVLIGRVSHRVFLKLESANGGGASIKARTARSLLDRGAADGSLELRSTIVESSSGNLACALAIQATARGYGVIVVLDPLVTPINQERIHTAGAGIEMVDVADANGNYLPARLARVAELQREYNAWWPNQYGSPANPEAHYHGTGAEICTALPEADAIFVPTSTGGTAAGIAQRVRAASLPTQVIPVDVPGSRALVDGRGRRLLPGVGSARRSEFVEPTELRRAMIVADERGIAASLALAEQTGTSIGGSSGVALVAALEWLADRRPSTVVVVCADAASNYDFSAATLARDGVVLPSLAGLVDDFYIPGPRGTLPLSAPLVPFTTEGASS
jgi:cysteine synthase